MTSVLPWPQLAGAVSVRAGWPGSNGSTMATNGAAAAAGSFLVTTAGLDVPPPARPDDPDEPQPASIAASPAPHNASTAIRATGGLTAPSYLANSINPSSPTSAINDSALLPPQQTRECPRRLHRASPQRRQRDVRYSPRRWSIVVVRTTTMEHRRGCAGGG